VILIDEFDKANSVFHSAFYQLFDDGVFEDKNYRVDVGPALIICTSNYTSEDEVRRSVGDALYSRFDSVVEYKSLDKDDLVSAIDRIADARFETLAPDERACLDVADLKSKLRMLAEGNGNVRKLQKLIDEIVSLALVRAILGDAPSVSSLDNEGDLDSARSRSPSTQSNT
jgi:ATP-dependent Clp protease ATP-binding subunit ClpA